MPLYEYECNKCGHKFEVVQKFSDEPLKHCEEKDCDGEVKKLISMTKFELKGSCWYRDGYK